MGFRRSAVMALLACAGYSSPAAVRDGGPAGEGGIPGASCTGDATACFSGTLMAQGFTASVRGAVVGLYDVFPGVGQIPVSMAAVSLGTPWAFSSVAPGTHYYLQATVDFGLNQVTRVVGPLSIPSSGPLAIDVPLAAVEVFESAAVGGSMTVARAQAKLFDPGTGAVVTDGGSVSLDVADASLALQLDTDAGLFWVEPAMPPDAAPSYALTATWPGATPPPQSFTLLADPLSSGGTIASIAALPPSATTIDAGALATIPGDAGADATLPTGDPLVVTFSGPSDSDYAEVELFWLRPQGDAGSFSLVYQSPSPESPATTQEAIGASLLGDAGTYLLDVLYAKANCPVTAGGCVQAAIAAPQEFQLGDAGAP